MHKAHPFSFVTFFFFLAISQSFLVKKFYQNVSKNENYYEKLQNVLVHYKDLKGLLQNYSLNLLRLELPYLNRRNFGRT